MISEKIMRDIELLEISRHFKEAKIISKYLIPN